jgi:hypothetical protein
MAMTIVDRARAVTGGVDTHLDLNVAAAVDALGGLLGVAQFPTTVSGHGELLAGCRALARWPWWASRARARTGPASPAT